MAVRIHRADSLAEGFSCRDAANALELSRQHLLAFTTQPNYYNDIYDTPHPRKKLQPKQEKGMKISTYCKVYAPPSSVPSVSELRSSFRSINLTWDLVSANEDSV